ncbi:hypothetical protein MARPU_07545 [Marichromatium purpuratum 984]|uniref:Uncharacterized protein n=1 Tax=Marichromatium purpuratum 984 TaxID=765910 RepID=W0E3Y6_MARPU|nr:hypothetical protein MARPU_07545 [Marichromatium purpuratum 984]
MHLLTGVVAEAFPGVAGDAREQAALGGGVPTARPRVDMLAPRADLIELGLQNGVEDAGRSVVFGLFSASRAASRA